MENFKVAWIPRKISFIPTVEYINSVGSTVIQGNFERYSDAYAVAHRLTVESGASGSYVAYAIQ